MSCCRFFFFFSLLFVVSFLFPLHRINCRSLIAANHNFQRNRHKLKAFLPLFSIIRSYLHSFRFNFYSFCSLFRNISFFLFFFLLFCFMRRMPCQRIIETDDVDFHSYRPMIIWKRNWGRRIF